jgi:hypothetical protein
MVRRLLALAPFLLPLSAQGQTTGHELQAIPATSSIELTVELIAAHPRGEQSPKLKPLLAQLRSRGLHGAVSLDRGEGNGRAHAQAWGRDVQASVEQTVGTRSRVHLLVSQSGRAPRRLAVEIPTGRPVLVVVAQRDSSLLLASVQASPHP